MKLKFFTARWDSVGLRHIEQEFNQFSARVTEVGGTVSYQWVVYAGYVTLLASYTVSKVDSVAVPADEWVVKEKT